MHFAVAFSPNSLSITSVKTLNTAAHQIRKREAALLSLFGESDIRALLLLLWLQGRMDPRGDIQI